MDKVQLVAIGGCHVDGYLVEKGASFVDHLEQRFMPCLVHKETYVKVSKLGQLVSPVAQMQPDYVFMQLGNYEFTGSWGTMLEVTVGLPAWIKSFVTRRPAAAEAAVGRGSAAARPVVMASEESRAQQLAVSNDIGEPSWRRTRRLVGSILYIITWVLLRKHRRQFQQFNQLIKDCPRTTFVCMTPFACLSGPHNLMRKVGGWIMKQRLAAYPNLRWVDTQPILAGKPELFADGVHLNADGHRVLAERLWQACMLHSEVARA